MRWNWIIICNDDDDDDDGILIRSHTQKSIFSVVCSAL
jgi:hypothetical protein